MPSLFTSQRGLRLRIWICFAVFLSKGVWATTSPIPEWAKDIVWYQIFPERFANGDTGNEPTRNSLVNPSAVPESWSVSNWETPWYERADWENEMSFYFHHSVSQRRYGGDLQGVIDRLDYLKQLGISGIYFNPLFYARSEHKYDAATFHHIDPYLGPDPQGDLALIASEKLNADAWQWTAADKLFLRLLREAKTRGIRVIIDGVWNHTGRDFFAFKETLKDNAQSRFANWYAIARFDNPDTPQNEFSYRGWHGHQSLPEFAHSLDHNDLMPGPKNYIFHATARWMDPNQDGNPEDGIDGWRLDVAEELPAGFWRDWHKHVRSLNPEAFTTAEIWLPSADFVAENHFTTAMNYHGFAVPVKGWLIDARISAGEFAKRLGQGRENRTLSQMLVQQNLVDSHDTQRLASAIKNRATHPDYLNADWFDYDEGSRVTARHPDYQTGKPDAEGRRIWKMVALFQATYPGAPMIYYGTEIGLHGADDPDDRMPAPWHDPDKEMLECYRAVIELRNTHEALRRGGFRVIETHNVAQVFVFERNFKGEKIIIALNRGLQDFALGDDLASLQLAYSTATEATERQLPYLSASVYIEKSEATD